MSVSMTARARSRDRAERDTRENCKADTTAAPLIGRLDLLEVITRLNCRGGVLQLRGIAARRKNNVIGYAMWKVPRGNIFSRKRDSARLSQSRHSFSVIRPTKRIETGGSKSRSRLSSRVARARECRLIFLLFLDRAVFLCNKSIMFKSVLRALQLWLSSVCKDNDASRAAESSHQTHKRERERERERDARLGIDSLRQISDRCRRG